ncbi:MAG TPA: hypothetical protein P5136_00225 [Methanofastidiosum sp.]|nr:hypothetical protein [Methanofastidiosum sp.]
MFLQVGPDQYVNLQSVVTIRIFDLSEEDEEESGFKIGFVTNAISEMERVVHSCEDKCCDILDEIICLPVILFYNTIFPTMEEANSWVEENFKDLIFKNPEKIN